MGKMIVVKNLDEYDGIPKRIVSELDFIWCLEPQQWIKNKNGNFQDHPDIYWSEGFGKYMLRSNSPLVKETELVRITDVFADYVLSIKPESNEVLPLPMPKGMPIVDDEIQPTRKFKKKIIKNEVPLPCNEVILTERVECCLGRDIIEEQLKEKGEQMTSENCSGGCKGDKMGSGMVGKDLGDGRYGMEDGNVATKLLDKNFSPMIIRKYTRLGFPLYVHMICDENLDDLDTIVHDCIDYCKSSGVLSNNIQSLRNFTGVLSDWINKHYDEKKRGCVESLAIIFYCDKMIISSLQGDCMNHNSCRYELYASLQLMTQI